MKKLFLIALALVVFESAWLAIPSFAMADNAADMVFKLALNDKYQETSKYIKLADNSDFLKESVEAIRIMQSKSLPDVTQLKEFIRSVDWLPQGGFQKKIERNLSFNSSNEYIIEWFTFWEPSTNYGKLLFLHANMQLGKMKKIGQDDINALKYYWIKTDLDLAAEGVFLKKYKNLLTIEDCLNKVERLTWDKNYNYAQQLLNILPDKFHDFSKSRIALSKAAKADSKLLKPLIATGKRDELSEYLYITSLISENKHEGVADYLLRINQTNFPAQWWKLKNHAARDALKEKKYAIAYQLTINHNLSHGPEFAEAEWLIGWIALRFLHKHETAVYHFTKLYENSKLANTKSKAAYWLARAYEVNNDTVKANQWFALASKYPSTFYGLISIAKVHGSKKVDYFEEYAPSLFNSSKANYIRAEKIAKFLSLLEKNGGHSLAVQMIKNLPDLKLSGVEYRHIADNLVKKSHYSLAIDIGNTAANADAVLLKESYPKHIPIEMAQLPKALYLGIIRQESNFNQNAISTAGATGLMQLMPETAARMAKSLGLGKDAYARDPKSNVLKGTAYINELYGQYANVILTLAAYNAGPGNVKKWIATYGDPREFKSEYDMVDWIELIPYKETRNYVKKVLENFVVYNSMLSPKHNAKTIVAYLEN